MYALFVISLMRSTSCGQTSTQTVHPLSAMHFSLSTTTGTLVGVLASGMMKLPCSFDGSSPRFDALALVGVLLAVFDRDDVRIDGSLFAGHPAVRFAQKRVAEPV